MDRNSMAMCDKAVERVLDTNPSDLTIISAGMGHGKTRLLALLRQQPRLGPVHYVDAASGTDRWAELVDEVLGHVAAGATVTIDDLDSKAYAEFRWPLEMLVDQTPGRIVVAARDSLHLPTGRLRAQGRLVEIGEQQLQLTPMDIQDLVDGRELSTHGWSAGSLATASSGWALAVETALDALESLDLHRGLDVQSLVEQSCAEVAESAIDEIASRLGSDVVDVLTQASILATLHNDLVAAAVDETLRCPDVAFLPVLGAHVRPRTGGREVFEMMPVMRRAFARRLERTESAEARRERHRRVATAARELGELTVARTHYLEAGEAQAAADVIAQLYKEDRYAVREADVAAFDGLGLDDYVPLMLVRASQAGDRGEETVLDAVVSQLRHRTWSGELPNGFPTLAVAICEIEGLRYEQSAEFMQQVVDVNRRDGADVLGPHHAISQFVVAHHSFMLDDLSTARSFNSRSVSGYRVAKPRKRDEAAALVLSLELKALIDHDAGDTAGARAAFDIAQDLATDYGVAALIPNGDDFRRLVFSIIDASGSSQISSLRWIGEHGSTSTLRLQALIELSRLHDLEHNFEAGYEAFDAARQVGASFSAPTLLRRRLDVLARVFEAGPRHSSYPVAITAGERDVLRLLADETLTQADIGAVLGLSVNTVKSHLRSVYQKFGVSSRGAASERALMEGISISSLPWRLAVDVVDELRDSN